MRTCKKNSLGENVEPDIPDEPDEPVDEVVEYTYGNYRYTVDGSEATITGVVNPKVTAGFEIPSEVIHEGSVLAVTSIGDYAFVNNQNIILLDIPHTVKHIGDYAFANCSMLSTILYKVEGSDDAEEFEDINEFTLWANANGITQGMLPFGGTGIDSTPPELDYNM